MLNSLGFGRAFLISLNSLKFILLGSEFYDKCTKADVVDKFRKGILLSKVSFIIIAVEILIVNWAEFLADKKQVLVVISNFAHQFLLQNAMAIVSVGLNPFYLLLWR